MYESKQSMRNKPLAIDPYESKHSIRMRAEKRKRKQKGSGDYAAWENYQGSGIKLAGEGWKTGLGGTLAGLGILGGAGNIGTSTVEGLIGGAILTGIGASLIYSDKKKKQKGSGTFDDEFYKAIKQGIKKNQIGSGKRLTKKQIKAFVMENKDKPIHIKDIVGTDWKEKGKELIYWLNQKPKQQGQGIFGDIGRAFKKGTKAAAKFGRKATTELKKFAAGKTKLKPSHLLDIAAGVVGVTGAASAFIPGVDLISVPVAAAASLGLKSVAHLARTSGRGLSVAGSGVRLAGSGLSVAGAGKRKKGGPYRTNPGTYPKMKGRGPKQKAAEPGLTYLPSGKLKRDRYSVFYGYYPSTYGGLRKSDFLKKGRKIISKKKSLAGKAAAARFNKK
ncbi:MAG: hypothetical protein GY799_02355 [Desulfobulbaceae bacterium]|nr:hypothetical protein [Desulfobulbaceae bacterium]